ncbi:TRAP transporter solute receptor, unknown substrate 3 [Candidatus Rhodobacter oscarellae]|uniref:TRAP transporter solute receptor n=1 Tax=Candidatus Rhodobacter oscarellae TaxID=1675527 RepID=A0A0J9EA22_9RHOB|nr:TRAP transporter substrate-binding protein [Candidatus Rhodobacter lobularis]KMW59622.1 TRAP transporter solute receptor, unknown substrate 3 [Candidatus Rhodobacter lobularis]
MTILKTILGGAAALALSTAAYADELKLAHFSSTKYHLHNEMFLPLAEQIAEATGGATTIRVYPGGELGKGPVKQYDRVLDGVADIVYALPGYTASQFKKTLLVEFPGIVPGNEDITKKMWENIDIISDEFRRTKLLGVWTAEPGKLLMADKKVEKLSDLAGLKIRVPSKNTGLVVEAWGATAVSMPITQVYTSMETGVVDGVLVDTSVLKSFKLGEVTKYVTTGMDGSNSVFMLVMNRDSWDSLDADTQAKLEAIAGAEMSQGGHVTMSTAGVKALEAWAADGGEVVELSAEAKAEFDAASVALAEKMIAELEADGVSAAEWAAALK